MMLHIIPFINRAMCISTSSFTWMPIKIICESQTFSFSLVFPNAMALLNKNGKSTQCYNVLRGITKPTHKVSVAVLKELI